MKNSELLLVVLLITGIGMLLWADPVVFLLILIVASVVGLFGYTVFCILETSVRENHEYGNKFSEYTIVPRKYNILSMFIDWIDSFPQILKKKQ